MKIKMERLFLSGLLMALIATSCTNAPGTDYRITGTIEGLPEGSNLELVPVSHEMEAPMADTAVVNGSFVFKGSTDEPRAVLLKVKGAGGAKHLMLENRNIKIEGAVTSSESNGNIFYNFSNVSVKGSPLTDHYLELMSVRDSLNEMHRAYTTKYEEVASAFSRARMDKDQQAIDSIMATDEYKAMADAEKNFFTTVETSYKQIVMDNKDSYWGPLMMISLTAYLGEDMKSWYEELSPEAKESYYGLKVHAELYPVGNVGSKVEEFTVKDVDGTEITFAELRQGKKYILLDFWASWCNPCLKEIPRLKSLYGKYKDKGFEIVSISIDEKEEDWKKKSEEVNLSWPSYLDRDGIASLYKVRVIPTMYLVDEQGVLVAENVRGEELEDKLAELFK